MALDAALSSAVTSVTVVQASCTGANGATDQGPPASAHQGPEAGSAQRAGTDAPPRTPTPVVAGSGDPVLCNVVNWHRGCRYQQPDR